MLLVRKREWEHWDLNPDQLVSSGLAPAWGSTLQFVITNVSKLVGSHFPVKLEPVRMPDYPMLPRGAGIPIVIFIDCGLAHPKREHDHFMKSLHSLQYHFFKGGMNFRSWPHVVHI